MPNQGSLVYEDAALVLELATHIDEYPFRKHGILSTIRMERWEHTNSLGNFPAEKFLQQGVQFFGRVVLTIYLSRYPQSLLREFVEHHVYVGAANDWLTRCHVISEFLYRHIIWELYF